MVYPIGSGFIAILLVIAISASGRKIFFFQHIENINSSSDSIEKSRQRSFDSVAEIVYENDDLAYRLKKIEEDIENKKRQIQQAKGDSATMRMSINFKDICSALSVKTDKQIFDYLKSKFDSLSEIVDNILYLTDSLKLLMKDEGAIQLRYANAEKNYDNVLKYLSHETAPLNGKYQFKFKNVECTFFFADKDKHSVSILPPPEDGPSTIGSMFHVSMSQERDTPLMITNGGMFRPDYKPQGLLISKNRQMHEVDTTRMLVKRLNFYLEPNGIFYIDSAGYYGILSTSEYMSFFKNKRMPKFATQSGPLLVNKRQLNTNIADGSLNLNIRSGVGLMSNEKIVFAISQQPINFYDFSIIMRDFFHCDYALFLDGAISKMYTNDKYPNGVSPVTDDGTFGPIIIVKPKK